MSDYYIDLVQKIKELKPNKDQLSNLKTKLCKIHKLKQIPTDIQIGLNIPESDLKEIKSYLISKPTRTDSGVAVVAIMSHPFKCPHGACTMCPSKTDTGVPQSYTGNEPATMRAMRHDFDSYLQVFNRLEQYVVLGQNPNKVELIVMGGTFPSYDKTYQEKYITNAFNAMNDFSRTFYRNSKFNLKKFKDFFELPGNINDEERAKSIAKKVTKLKQSNKDTLVQAQRKNERSQIKCVGMTLETRPDYARIEQIDHMLKLGATRIELGVQTTNDKALKKINRGHDIQETIDSTSELKDSAFKINYHMMIGLPGQTKAEDLQNLKDIFSKDKFKPDMLKIYPCMVIEQSELFKDFKKGKFTPVSTQEASKIIGEFKPSIPTYCRVMRVQRDIPTKVTVAGVDKTNLRQYVEQYLEKNKLKCRCIRCREVEIQRKKYNKTPKDIEIIVQEYKASNGTEYFISAEDVKQDIILGFCRLRFPNNPHRKELKNNTALIRELHVYGTSEKLKQTGTTQHIGLGTKLLKKAESIAKKHNFAKMAVISGVGVREYYRQKHHYRLQGPYMVKNL